MKHTKEEMIEYIEKHIIDDNEIVLLLFTKILRQSKFMMGIWNELQTKATG